MAILAWTKTAKDCYERHLVAYGESWKENILNFNEFKACEGCFLHPVCKSAGFALRNAVNNTYNKFGKPEIKEEKELSGFCIDEDCKYCKLLEDDKLQIFCKHPYKLKKTFPKYGFKCQQYEKRTQEEEKQPMESVRSKIEILQKFIHLSPRENDVLSLYLDGEDKEEILKKLNISEGALIQYDFLLRRKFKKYINFDDSNKIQQILKFVKGLDSESLPKPVIATGEIKTIPLLESKPEIIPNFNYFPVKKNEVSISDLIERAKKKIAGDIEAIEKQILDLNLNFSNSNEVRQQIHNKKMEHKELSVQIKAIETIGKQLLEMEQE